MELDVHYSPISSLHGRHWRLFIHPPVQVPRLCSMRWTTLAAFHHAQVNVPRSSSLPTRTFLFGETWQQKRCTSKTLFTRQWIHLLLQKIFTKRRQGIWQQKNCRGSCDLVQLNKSVMFCCISPFNHVLFEPRTKRKRRRKNTPQIQIRHLQLFAFGNAVAGVIQATGILAWNTTAKECSPIYQNRQNSWDVQMEIPRHPCSTSVAATMFCLYSGKKYGSHRENPRKAVGMNCCTPVDQYDWVLAHQNKSHHKHGILR